mgnify:CR=1 FL=1
MSAAAFLAIALLSLMAAVSPGSKPSSRASSR